MASKASRPVAAADCSVVMQTLVLSLYEGGVLSPAVLERVIAAAGANAAIDWAALSTARANDRRTLAEIVVAVMMPGNALDDVERDFAAVIEHIAGRDAHAARRNDEGRKTGADTRSAKKRPAASSRTGQRSENDDNDGDSDVSDDDALLAQLSGTAKASRKRASSASNADTKRGFNLSNNAVPPKRRK